MRVFDVYSHTTDGYEAVPQGWNWVAFFFTWIWAFYRGLGVLAVACFCGLLLWRWFCIEVVIESWGRPDWYFIVVFVPTTIVQSLFGFFGNAWVVKRLLSSGYVQRDCVYAKSKKHAISGSIGSGSRKEQTETNS